MIDRRYVLEKPPAPPAWKRYLDLTVLPTLIDAAGALEGVVERVSVGGRVRPLTQIAVALGLGYGLGWITSGRRRS
jgi:hypothetical protein